jgi:hypothetical protein
VAVKEPKPSATPARPLVKAAAADLELAVQQIQERGEVGVYRSNGAGGLLDVPQFARLVRGQMWGLDGVWKGGDDAARRMAVAQLILLGAELEQARRRTEAAATPQGRRSLKIVSFGKLTVATPGTPVQVTSTPTPVVAMVFSSVAGAGKVYVGLANIVGATGAGVLGEVLQPAAGPSDRLRIDAEEGNQLDAASFYLDAAAGGATVYAFGLQQ